MFLHKLLEGRTRSDLAAMLGHTESWGKTEEAIGIIIFMKYIRQLFQMKRLPEHFYG